MSGADRKQRRHRQAANREAARRWQQRREGSSGAASPCFKIDPATGERTVIERSPADAPTADAPPDTPEPPPTNPGAAVGSLERQRAAWRDRKRRQKKRADSGQLVVRLVLDDGLLDALVAYRWIGEWDRRDRVKVADVR